MCGSETRCPARDGGEIERLHPRDAHASKVEELGQQP
jgi:hypothetical protein